MNGQSRVAAKDHSLGSDFYRPLTGLLTTAHWLPRLGPLATLFRHSVAEPIQYFGDKPSRHRDTGDMRTCASFALLLFALSSNPLFSGDVQPPLRAKPEGTIKLKLRTRVETFKGSSVWD